MPENRSQSSLAQRRSLQTLFSEHLKTQEAQKAKTAIRHLLEREDVLILDTETNGTGAGTEVIEVSEKYQR